MEVILSACVCCVRNLNAGFALSTHFQLFKRGSINLKLITASTKSFEPLLYFRSRAEMLFVRKAIAKVGAIHSKQWAEIKDGCVGNVIVAKLRHRRN
jgi:hypothetical protein